MSLLNMHLNWVANLGIAISCLPNADDVLALKAFIISGHKVAHPRAWSAAAAANRGGVRKLLQIRTENQP
jgi:hypothetical protein